MNHLCRHILMGQRKALNLIRKLNYIFVICYLSVISVTLYGILIIHSVLRN